MPCNPFYSTPEWKALRKACFERDGYRCTVAGCRQRGCVADHIETRPNVPHLTPKDRLENLRTLCKTHDGQVKERKAGQGQRARDGAFVIRGCDAEGWPLDPARRA